MRDLLFVLFFISFFSCSCGCVVTSPEIITDQNNFSEDTRVRNVQEKECQETELRGLIAALQNDPEMQAVLQDPAAMNAVLTMDMEFIENDPRFKKLRNNPRMREVLKRFTQ